MTTSDEEFAELIGNIVRLYIDFKKMNNEGENNNSLSNILTYSKYDREVLRFIMSLVARGIELSKVSEDKKKILTEKITKLQPKKEISDDAVSNDFSCFFFKGYYAKLELTA